MKDFEEILGELFILPNDLDEKGACETAVTYGREGFFFNKMKLISVIERGVPYDLFEKIAHFLPFSDVDWAELFDLSTKSLQRYRKSNKRFKSIYSEKIIEMAEITFLGIELFGTIEKFHLWLGTPNFALGNQKPIDLLSSSYGKDMVVDELVHIDQGIFA